MMSEQIRGRIFVSGVGRSGTTCMVRALQQHPDIFQVAGPGAEMPYLRSFIEYVKSLSEGTWAHEIFAEQGFDYVTAFARTHVHILENQYILRYKKPGHRGTYYVGKLPEIDSFQEFSYYLKLFENCRFIFMLRNGMDVVESRRKYMGERLGQSCRKYADVMSRQLTFLDHEKILPVYHERLIESPEEEFRRIYQFLGLPYSGASAEMIRGTILHPTKNGTQDMNVKGRRDKIVTVKEDHQAFFKKSPRPYENWSESEKAAFVDICGAVMKKLGYEIPYAQSRQSAEEVTVA